VEPSCVRGASFVCLLDSSWSAQAASVRADPYHSAPAAPVCPPVGSRVALGWARGASLVCLPACLPVCLVCLLEFVWSAQTFNVRVIPFSRPRRLFAPGLQGSSRVGRWGRARPSKVHGGGGRRGCVAVSRFLAFPIQTNFSERGKWPTRPRWRGQPTESPGGSMRRGRRAGKASGQPLLDRPRAHSLQYRILQTTTAPHLGHAWRHTASPAGGGSGQSTP
jgi:hypothetical protein